MPRNRQVGGLSGKPSPRSAHRSGPEQKAPLDRATTKNRLDFRPHTPDRENPKSPCPPNHHPVPGPVPLFVSRLYLDLAQTTPYPHAGLPRFSSVPALHSKETHLPVLFRKQVLRPARFFPRQEWLLCRVGPGVLRPLGRGCAGGIRAEAWTDGGRRIRLGRVWLAAVHHLH